MRKLIIWAGIWFAGGFIFYMIRPDLVAKVLERLQEIFGDIFGEEGVSQDFRTVFLIFQNNFRAALLILFGGIIFGLVPLVAILVNFFLLGLLLAFSLPALGVFLLAVLPHGILEIPALLIAATFGLRFGLFWTRPVKTKGKGANFLLALKDIFVVLPLLITLLLLAAII